MRVRRLALLLPLLVTASPASAVDYATEIKPLLARRCTSCHGGLTQEAGLRLDASVLILRGNDDGPVIVPGKPEESRLYQAITGTGDVEKMPAEGDPLSDAEIELVKTWIAEDAKAVDEPIPPDPRDHWAFKPPQRPAVAAARNASWIRNPVDSFIAARHEENGLRSAPEADKRTLLRRVYLDLIGLPPTPAQLKAFLENPSSNAYEIVVDQLLASPHYGERWGRHWMDVWRYSDWDGHGEEIRNSQRHIWRWRDWIVESLNSNVPYDQMIVAMLAADEASPTDPSALRATGFLARNWYKFNRDTWLESSVEHTSKAFVGLTINCARCHDHKYDPIAQADYYHFRAFFEPYDVRTDRVPGQADVLKDGLPRIYDANAAAPTYIYERGNVKEPRKDRLIGPSLPSVVQRSPLAIKPVDLPPAAYYPGLQEFVQKEIMADAEKETIRLQSVAMTAQEQLVAAKRELDLAAATPSDLPPIDSPILTDDFKRPRAELWRIAGGQWSYEPAPLKQSAVGESFARLVSLADHPADFVAEFRFRITGGQRWRSVGLSFDLVDDQNWQAVYLSAVETGPKVLHFFRKSGQDVNPPDATLDYPVKLGEDYRLRVAVRGQQIAIWVNDNQVFLGTTPQPRTAGKFAVWTFDASTEFISVSLAPLNPSVPLTTPLVQLQARFEIAAADTDNANKRTGRSKASVAWIKARIAADALRYGTAAPDEIKRASIEAERAERAFNQFKAEAEIAAARLEILKADQANKPADEKAKLKQPHEQKLAEATKQLEVLKTQSEPVDGKYTPLTAIYPAQSTGRRLALARWIANKENPLTARVAVNQIWMRHFGTPLVNSVFNFGNSGARPTHPELLDWLAVEFAESGWDMKALHRLLVTSNVYRLASSHVDNAEARAKDPDNRLLWRMNSRRMEAEIVRDTVLAVSGQLDLTMGGPDLDPNLGGTLPRRSLYFRHVNEKRVMFLNTFDSASVQECYRRAETVTPQQALALANSPLALSESRRLAAVLSTELAASGSLENAAFVRTAFERTLGRRASEKEAAASERFLTEQIARFIQPSSLSNVGVDQPGVIAASPDAQQRARESLVHVLLNHHEFLTIR